MRVLAISDKVEDLIYGPGCKQKFSHIDFIISCGDLPYYYVEYVLNALDKPLFYVRGNHANKVEYTKAGERTQPRGGMDLHNRHTAHLGVLMAGVQGSIRYNKGAFQYTQAEMWGFVFNLVPRMLYNRASTGRFLDVFVTHASPFGTHDKTDPAHVGIKAFTWLNSVFKPRLHLHGHIHRYHPNDPVSTRVGDTLVVNVYGYQELQIPGFESTEVNNCSVVGPSR